MFEYLTGIFLLPLEKELITSPLFAFNEFKQFHSKIFLENYHGLSKIEGIDFAIDSKTNNYKRVELDLEVGGIAGL